MPFLTAADGTPIAFDDCVVAQPQAAVVLVHGYAEHRGRYRYVVERLNEAGISCYLFDLRGHGESGGRRGHVDRFELYLDDLSMIVTRAGGSTAAPLFLFGHSLGGLIALSYVRAHAAGLRAVAVSSPFLHPQFAVSPFDKMLTIVGSRLAPSLSVASGLDPNGISRDPNVVAAYVDDPLVFSNTTPRWFDEVSRAQRELAAHAAEITLPALFLVGGADPIASSAFTTTFFATLGSADKTFRPYEGLLHEVLNEPERDLVIHDLQAWIAARASQPEAASSLPAGRPH